MPRADLGEYRRKRDPKRTPEPVPVARREPGGSRKRGRKPIFVVQRHDARRLHYDFRLERDGALASWAVPKGIPLEAGQRVLAVHVEDHPLDYATFEGEIPKGEYGAGTVEIWDRGTYELVEEKKDGGLTVRLEGDRLRGLWTLVPAKLDGDPKNWLLIRKRDDITPNRGSAPVRIAREYQPMLATLAEELPSGPGWLFEVKWDGYRALAYIRGGEASLVSRNGNDLTERFRTIASQLARATKSPALVLDGEICALDENGRPSFSAMQQGKPGTPIVYEVFDVLEVEGKPLVDLPLAERRARLETLLDRRNTTVRLSEAFEDGKALFEAALKQRLEGVIAKRADSPYRQGKRTREWLKVKTHGRQEFVIAGYTKGQGRRSGRVGSLVLGVWRGGELAYVGNCGTGFTDKDIDELLARLRPLEQKESPFPVVPRMPKVRKADVVWVKPELVCEVEFVEWTHDGRLRAPSFQGLREDKAAREVHREEPIQEEIRRGKRVLRLTNLDKVFWPEERITKGDLLAYYRAVAAVLLPHIRDRPFTMKRYPDGIEGGHFFQKHPSSAKGKALPSVKGDYFFVNDELDLLAAVNVGCIDMNAWLSRIDKPDRPDFVMFDLDPSSDVGFPEVVQVALLVKAMLDGLGLNGFPKTSGADGMHVLVPITRRSTYADTREFVSIIRRALASTHRGLVTTEWTKAKRKGVLIDANQNREGATTASVYSVRPKEGAPVSTPLRWDEVNESLDPAAFTMDVVLDRVSRHGDLFEGVLTEKQSLAKALDSLR